MKPELTGLSVLTTLCGYYLATDGVFDVSRFLLVALGTMLVGGGLGALNQYIERHYDALMKRTERRPLPSGRMEPGTAFWFGTVILIAGIVIMFVYGNIVSGIIAATISAVYLFLYTPLKRITSWSTIIGGIPGALPPVMGWTAAGGELSAAAWILFAILFFWQIPHFYALAWMYRKDYARAGFAMLAVKDQLGTRLSLETVLYIVVLIVSSLGLYTVGVAGMQYVLAALVSGALFLVYGVLFFRFSGKAAEESMVKINQVSRRLFFASLWYLPVLMIFMVIDKL
ncbi:MAG: heme o synthase [Ignavibacteriae bacterium]|nr:heme o synthase [Ignavibacteriota bacterium]